MYVILMRFCVQLLQALVSCFRRRQQHKRFCLAFPNIAVGSSTALYGYFARHCCWHRNFQLSPSGFHCQLEFCVVWLNEEYSSQLLTLSSFGFSIAHLCFALFFATSDIIFHISGHASSGREVVCFLVSLLSCGRTKFVNLVHAYDNSFSSSTFQ